MGEKKIFPYLLLTLKNKISKKYLRESLFFLNGN